MSNRILNYEFAIISCSNNKFLAISSPFYDIFLFEKMANALTGNLE